MAKESIVQIRMDADTKKQAETLYKSLGTNFSEAIRIFARQSIIEHGFPFMIKNNNKTTSTKGRLYKYASLNLQSKEKEAFKKATVSKHE